MDTIQEQLVINPTARILMRLRRRQAIRRARHGAGGLMGMGWIGGVPGQALSGSSGSIG
jgi:hypothetical protein